VLGEGLEPSRGCPHRILNPARLPIPPPEPGTWNPPPTTGRSGTSGAEGNRTPDLLNAIQALSQLSYGPDRTSYRRPWSSRPASLDEHGPEPYVNQRSQLPAGLTGLEPAASGVTDRHSNQLSYSPLPYHLHLPPCINAPTGNRTPTATLKEWSPSR
jgi:hypothetical protein